MSRRPSGRDSTTCSTITCNKEFHFYKKHLKVETTQCRGKSRDDLRHRPPASRLPHGSARQQVNSRHSRAGSREGTTGDRDWVQRAAGTPPASPLGLTGKQGPHAAASRCPGLRSAIAQMGQARGSCRGRKMHFILPCCVFVGRLGVGCVRA